jgi:hypothetical protein
MVKIKFIKIQEKGRITFLQAGELVKEVGLLDPAGGFDHLYKVHANSGKRTGITFKELKLALKDLDCLERGIKLMVKNIKSSGDNEGRVQTETAMTIMKPYFPRESHGDMRRLVNMHSVNGFWRKSRNSDYIRMMRPWEIPEDEIEY